jgi:hypothetical protein
VLAEKPAAKPPVAAKQVNAAKQVKPLSPVRVAGKTEPVLRTQKTAASPAQKQSATVSSPSRERVLEVGSFADAKHAYALRYDVGTRFDDDRVLVARVDPEDGPPEYRVRVVGLKSTRDEADAAAALHGLGHDFVRYEKPGALQRFGRKVWAGFKGR